MPGDGNPVDKAQAVEKDERLAFGVGQAATHSVARNSSTYAWPDARRPAQPP